MCRRHLCLNIKNNYTGGPGNQVSQGPLTLPAKGRQTTINDTFLQFLGLWTRHSRNWYDCHCQPCKSLILLVFFFTEQHNFTGKLHCLFSQAFRSSTLTSGLKLIFRWSQEAILEDEVPGLWAYLGELSHLGAEQTSCGGWSSGTRLSSRSLTPPPSLGEPGKVHGNNQHVKNNQSYS